MKVEKNEACSFDSGACCDLEEARRGEERRSSSEGGGRREEDDGDRSIDRSIDGRRRAPFGAYGGNEVSQLVGRGAGSGRGCARRAEEDGRGRARQKNEVAL